MRVKNDPWVAGNVVTTAGPVPLVATRLGPMDLMGSIKVRLGIQRMHYIITPGLYGVGAPTPDSPVFVSANYKLSFDHLRRELSGIDCWIMVIDTKGVNVWCAAGKGTFGTDEIVNRIEATQLAQIVNHRTIIVPQLGAPGVSAHRTKQRSSFRVVYGPVLARDIPQFMASGMNVTPAMRRVEFRMGDRLVLVPLELIQWGWLALLIAVALYFMTGFGPAGYSLPGYNGVRQAILLLAAFAGAGIFVPLLLPWLPGRAFSVKGTVLGLLIAAATILPGLAAAPPGLTGLLEASAWILLMPSAGAFMAMNFTGSTTFTSLSGVKKEMKCALPLQITGAVLGLGLWLLARFF